MQTSLTPDNSDVTDAIRKGQISNSGDCTKIGVRCVHVLILFKLIRMEKGTMTDCNCRFVHVEVIIILLQKTRHVERHSLQM
jgi:hypothetical protein